jgi:uncharacterized protein YndB with AHSA1/START domain
VVRELRSPDGQDYWGSGVYRELVPRERIVYTDSFADAGGNPVPLSHSAMSDDHPEETLVTVTFLEREGRTSVTLRHTIAGSGAAAQLRVRRFVGSLPGG